MLHLAGCPGLVYMCQPRQIATSGTGERLQAEFDSESLTPSKTNARSECRWIPVPRQKGDPG